MTNPEVSARTIQMLVHEFIQSTDEWLIGRDECVVHYHLTQRRTRAASESFELFQRLPCAGVRILDAKEMNITIHVSHEAVIIDHPGIRACRIRFVDQLELTVHNRNSQLRKASSCIINHCVSPANILFYTDRKFDFAATLGAGGRLCRGAGGFLQMASAFSCHSFVFLTNVTAGGARFPVATSRWFAVFPGMRHFLPPITAGR